MNLPRTIALLPLVLLPACEHPEAPREPAPQPKIAAPERPHRPVTVQSWGTMMEVLRMGQSAGRVRLIDVARPTTMGVGAMAGLTGEVTLLDGRALVAQADPEDANAILLREAQPDDQAALLIAAEVPAWEERSLPACSSYDELEHAIAEHLEARGDDRSQPVPVRVRGTAKNVHLHVIDGACPIARPDGPPPRRHVGVDEPVELIGFYVEGAAGRFTHHQHTSHLHVVSTAGVMGHLDAIELGAGATLSLPAR